jgi:arabinose-5-phosphate isomerase
MLDTTHAPQVNPEASIKKVIMEISEKRLGVTAVIENNKVIGIITDGDIRRMLNDRDTFADLTAKDIMTKSPKNISTSILVSEALNVLENNAITQLVVIDEGEYKGIIHLHDILKEGIV